MAGQLLNLTDTKEMNNDTLKLVGPFSFKLVKQTDLKDPTPQVVSCVFCFSFFFSTQKISLNQVPPQAAVLTLPSLG